MVAAGDDSMKIVMVGPRGCGKSTVANVLGDVQVQQANPTKGVRIVEFETETSPGTSVSIELWDVGGDEQAAANFLPALKHEVVGVLLVFSPGVPQQVQESKRFWYQKFVKQAGLSPQQVLVLQTGVPEIDRASLPPAVPNAVPVQDPSDQVHYRHSFNRFVQSLYDFQKQKRADEENSIMGGGQYNNQGGYQPTGNYLEQ